MPFEADRGPLGDILYHIELIEQFVHGKTQDEFCEDTLLVCAVTRCLEIISEASRRLSDDLKARYPAIGWKEMAGAGNIYRHNY